KKRIGEVNQYIKEFEQASIHLDWNQSALIAKFIDGLHEEVKCELLMRGDKARTLLSAFHMAMLIDSNLQRKYQVHKGYRGASIYNPFVHKKTRKQILLLKRLNMKNKLTNDVAHCPPKKTKKT
ncbi:hypothetical protein LY90DRAFT_624762, partial [Neocallimastix californiae]